MDFRKIIIDKDVFIKYVNRQNYELHIRNCGPNGAWVYKFENGLLKWRQLRSYSFVTKLYAPIWDK